ncbi:hypothetical protein D3C73_1267700 [compost metagenome]
MGVMAFLMLNTSVDPTVWVLMVLKNVSGGSYCNAFLAIKAKKRSFGFCNSIVKKSFSCSIIFGSPYKRLQSKKVENLMAFSGMLSSIQVL